MPLIERYILRRTIQIFLLTLGALVAVLWIVQVLKELDVVTAKGQAISVFLLMTLFGLPALVQAVAPIAYLVAVVVTLNALSNDGELPVIPAAGAAPKSVNRPILLLGVIVMLAVAFSYHVLTPASLANFREILTRVRADVIATLAKPGGFRAVDRGLTMHFRAKAPDGSFRDIFVNDERDPKESVTFTAARGLLMQHAGGSYLVLQDGDIVRADHVSGDSNVVSFQTYALDLSQLGPPSAAPVYQAMERSTLFLLDPSSAGDSYTQRFPQRVRTEINERTTAPLFTLAFGLIALAFLGHPQSNRQSSSAAITSVVVACLLLRVLGFGAMSVAYHLNGAIPFMYGVPLIGIAFGVYAMTRSERLRPPAFVSGISNSLAEIARRASERDLARAGAISGDRP